MKLWRKQGAIGKLHNLIRFIRASPQREELFMDLAEAVSCTQDTLNEKTKNLHVIDDNKTRWNSTYLMIHRALRLGRRIEKFYSTKFSKEKDFPTSNILSDGDWNELEIFKNLLHPFYILTMRLQGNNNTGSHGPVWECLVTIDIIREHLIKAKAEHLKGRHTGFLGIAINTGLSLAQKYYELITENPIYAAAVFLHPTQKRHSFNAKWTEKDKQLQVASYEETLKEIWVTQYSTTSPETPKSPSSKRLPLDIFDQFLTPDNAVTLELEKVIASDECTKPRDPFLSTLPPRQRWLQHEMEYPELTQWALDVHFIPATSAECERAFSSAGQLLTPRRNRLLDDVIEANECLMAWKMSGLFECFRHICGCYHLMVRHFSKSAPVGDKQNICRPLRFLFGVYGVFRAGFGIDCDLRWIMRADLRGGGRTLVLVGEGCLRRKVDILCIGEKLIDSRDMIRKFWALVSSSSIRTARSAELYLLIERVFMVTNVV